MSCLCMPKVARERVLMENRRIELAGSHLPRALARLARLAPRSTDRVIIAVWAGIMPGTRAKSKWISRVHIAPAPLFFSRSLFVERRRFKTIRHLRTPGTMLPPMYRFLLVSTVPYSVSILSRWVDTIFKIQIALAIVDEYSSNTSHLQQLSRNIIPRSALRILFHEVIYISRTERILISMIF